MQTSGNFCIFLAYELGKTLERDGWNVKWLEPRDKDDDEQAYIQVAVSYDNIPPKLVLVSSKGKTILTEETVNILDWAEIKNVDVIVRPYNWEVNGNTGVKAYVKSLYVTIVEDEFADKYYDVPDSAANIFDECDVD